ncbi:hypothetical protein [Salinisphaera sp.]|uniref:hypothetical protein n=1 Tax=Salinisphaera sp. TaxID=1914330 RepID=UPI000C51BF71|nr:hypothetical protein [Salinisphaera sp.]MBS63973.1 hypothetical protein [Salinisphaera sp.]
MVERWQGFEELSSAHPTQIVALSPDAQLAAHLGATKANQSSIDPEASPLAALLKTAKGQVDAADWQQATANADNKNTALSDTKRPHPADPVLRAAAMRRWQCCPSGSFRLPLRSAWGIALFRAALHRYRTAYGYQRGY